MLVQNPRRIGVIAAHLIVLAGWAAGQAVRVEFEEIDAVDGPAIDGAEFPPPNGLNLPTSRRAPELEAEFIQLPATISPDAPAGSLDEMGYVEPLRVELAPTGWGSAIDGSRVWAFELQSSGAVALRLRLRGAFGDGGLQLRVYDPSSGSAFGPYRYPILDDEGCWWTTVIFGDAIGLEFELPPGAADPPILPSLDAVALYYELPGEGASAGACSLIDVACEPDWRNDEARAVCMLATVSGGVVGFCSGALLNRAPADGCPLVMTANHCIGDQASANAAAFVWRFQASTCNGTPPNPNTLPRSAGALLLKKYADADWNLLGLYEPPAESTFLGWDSSFWISFADCTGIHHPSGTHKRISFGENTGALFGQFCDQNNQNCFWAHTWGVAWDRGTVQPGSSGSPIMDTNRRVRGTLTGLSDDCHAYYGRFAMAYDEVEPFIYDMASPVYVQSTYFGFERGTSGQPFNTVLEASFCVLAGDDLRIRAGVYADRCRIWRPMRLTSIGGIARIGQ